MQIIILAGGNSDERAVSLRSGDAVLRALTAGGHQARVLDPAAWPADYEAVLRAADVVFPVLHGKGGEDGVIQLWLEDRHLKYVGADGAASRLCFDKWRYKQAMLQAGLPVSGGRLVDEAAFQDIVDSGFHTGVLKPFDGGSSIDTFIIRDPEDIVPSAIKLAFTHHPRMLYEPLVEGIEITVGVLCDAALPVIEIVPPAGAEFDYDNKYNGKTQELCPPVSVSPELQSKAQDLALEIHQMLKIRDLSRTDIIIGNDGKLTVLETNTSPGLTDQSLLPKAALEAGLDMPALCAKLVQAAFSR